MGRAAAVAFLLLLLSLCWSCAAVMPGLGGPVRDHEPVLNIQHSYSKKPSDCLAVCVGMVLQYYGVKTTLPDTLLPLELISLTQRLNTGTPVDDEGHFLFATVLELSPGELAAQLAKQRPVIVAFKPSARAEYHSVVVSGYSDKREQFYINDPARRKPGWKALCKIPTFKDSEKYLTLLIGLQEK